jgi:hypothetical protein
MTFLEAVKHILEKSGNIPMTSREIWDKISKENLVKTKGKTPWASLNTIILLFCKSSPINPIAVKRSNPNLTELFEIVEKKPMKFRLLNYSAPPINKIDIDDKLEVQIDRILLYQVTSSELNWKKLSVFNNSENIEYEISDCEEYTYIMEDKAHATIKIGKTKNDPTLRFNQLKTANPSISMLHVFPSSQFSEGELHDKFSDFQKDLEWYFYAKGLKQFMSEEINKHNSIIKSYSKKLELDRIESEMFEMF